MTAAGATAGPQRVPRPLAGDPTLSVPIARGLAFVGLAGFGALHWMVLLDPAAPDRALYALGAAGVAILGLLAVGRIAEFRVRQLAAAGVALVALALAVLGGGVADELLRPDRWGALASGINRGIAALPGVRVPYRGVDEWIRVVIPLGGTVLVTAAAILAFWPRRNRLGFPAPALTLLVALYAVPAVSLDFENEFLRGAALALLVLAFLRLEKLRVGDAGNAGLVAAAVAIVALMLAPALDKDAPWWDYECWALGAASARTTSFTWDHDYGPLDWPRDGRELLRVRAQKRPAYWKAANLAAFDGRRWVQDDTFDEDPGRARERGGDQDGTQEIKVTIRNLSSRVYITAGYTDFLESPTIRETPRGDGTWIAGRSLRRGDAYTALVYTPLDEREPAPRGRQRDRPRGPGVSGCWSCRRAATASRAAPRCSRCCSRPSASSRRSSAGVAGRDGIQLNQRRSSTRSSAARTGGRGSSRRSCATRPTRGGPRPGGAHPPAARLRLHRDAAARGLQPRRLPLRRQGRRLPAVLGRHGAAPADGRRPTRVVTGLHLRVARHQDQGVRGARPRRPLVGRGLVPRHRLGHLRPDARRRPGALAAQRRAAPPRGRAPASGRRASAATCRPTPAAVPRLRRRAARGCRSC